MAGWSVFNCPWQRSTFQMLELDIFILEEGPPLGDVLSPSDSTCENVAGEAEEDAII